MMTDTTPPGIRLGPGGRGRRRPWSIVLAVLVAVVLIAAIAASSVPVSYYSVEPGPAGDVADFVAASPETATFTPEGDLLFLTVSLEQVSAFEFFQSFFDGEVDLRRGSRVRPDDVSPEDHHQISVDQIEDSKQTAIFVALSRLGFDGRLTGTGALVRDLADGSPADGTLELGDVITAIDGEEVRLADEAIMLLGDRRPGETVTLRVDRLGPSGTTRMPVDVPVSLGASPLDPDRAFLGVALDTFQLEAEFPVDIEIMTRNIGGPSAGMMFTLGIINLLTEEDITKGHTIAGTGTIRFDGKVGPIGGVRQKVIAARDIGAQYVLVPTENFADAAEAAGDDIRVVSIDTIDDALAFLSNLPAAGDPARQATGPMRSE